MTHTSRTFALTKDWDIHLDGAGNIALRTEGEATEVDKTVVELLADPLTHMIRNAIDHGLELPAERAGVGKPPVGRMTLSAVYGSTLAVFVNDDGDDHAETRAFLDRRIENVMQFEKVKARLLNPDRESFSLTRFLGRLRYPAR